MRFAAVLLVAFACGGDDANSARLVGSMGGELEFDGVRLSIPAGALSADAEIRAEQVSVPAGFTASRAYRFTPVGLEFALPVEVAFVGVAEGRMYWSARGGDADFGQVPSTVSGGATRGLINHFSIGFVGDVLDGGVSDAASVDSGVDASANGPVDGGVGASAVSCVVTTGVEPNCDVDFVTDTFNDVPFFFARDATKVGVISSTLGALERFAGGEPRFVSVDGEGTRYSMQPEEGPPQIERVGGMLRIDFDARRGGLCLSGALIGVQCAGTVAIPAPDCDEADWEADLRGLGPLRCTMTRRDDACALVPSVSESVSLTLRAGPHGEDSVIHADSGFLREVLGRDANFTREVACDSFALDVRLGDVEERILKFGNDAGVIRLRRESDETCSDGGTSYSRAVVVCEGMARLNSE